MMFTLCFKHIKTVFDKKDQNYFFHQPRMFFILKSEAK